MDMKEFSSLRFLLLLFITLPTKLTGELSLQINDMASRSPPDDCYVGINSYDHSSELEAAFTKSMEKLNDRETTENGLPNSTIVSPNLISVEARLYNFGGYSELSACLDKTGQILLGAANAILNSPKGYQAKDLKCFKLPGDSQKAQTALSECKECLKPYGYCQSTGKFERTIDGSCNNVNHKDWGRSHSCYERILPSDYRDGISTIRQSVTGGELPLARVVSRDIHDALDPPSGKFPVTVVQYGQFTAHDITLLLMTRTLQKGEMLNCCPVGYPEVKNPHPECLEIVVPQDADDFFSENNQTCINFVRSSVCSPNCQLGPREHSNQLTAYIDLSGVYGSTENHSAGLRTFSKGLLKSQYRGGLEFLPASFSPDVDQCSIKKENITCYEAGDMRANEQPMLAIVHTLWLRQHNRIARELYKRYPNAKDEDIFQKTRRILIAQHQNIVYSEFLGAVIGEGYKSYFKIQAKKNRQDRSNYRSDVEAAIFTETSTAAFRFGHTLIRNNMDQGYEGNDSLALDEFFQVPYVIMDGEMDPLLEGMYRQAAGRSGPSMVSAVTHNLYRQKTQPFGMDLAAINIQRGRDHGIAGYTKYLKKCFGRTVNKFNDLSDIISPENLKKLQSVYSSPDDVDLFTGGLSETGLKGAVVGPTFGCIIGFQFQKLKDGDRYYFEHKYQGGNFNDKQLAQIRKTRFSDIICKNTNIIKLVPNTFQLPNSQDNALQDCDDAFDIDLQDF